MASHHHHLCHHPTTTSYCRCCSPYPPCHHHSPPPPPPPECHPVFHPPPQPYLYSAQTSNFNHHHSHFQEETQTQHTVSTLLRRIAALESALRRRHSSSPHSLRDAAARTIQTHFRAFLLRRSRTLGQLKNLASIKSTLTILQSSVSEKTHSDCDVIYHKAVDLLLKLNTIQGGDQMIRDGKSSIRRELNAFLDFIDGFYVERRRLSSRVNVRNNVKHRVYNSERELVNVKSGSSKNVNEEKLRGMVERIDKLAEDLDGVSGKKNGVLMKQLCVVKPKTKKSVSFADSGKLYRVLRKNSVPFLDENDDDSSDRGNSLNARRDMIKNDLCREVDEIRVVSKEAEDEEEKEESDSESGGSLLVSDGEKYLRSYVNGGRDVEDDLCRGVDEIRVFSKEAEDEDEEEADSDSGGFVRGSDGEKDLRSYVRREGNLERKMYDQGEADNFTFSAPLPLKMERRAALIEKRKSLAK